MKLFRYIAPMLAAFLLALPSTALADPNDVIRDCNEDGKIDGNYSDEDLREAEENLPTDIDEYTDCRDVIRDARTGGPGSAKRRGSGGFQGSGAGGDPSLQTSEGAQAQSAADRDALEAATKDGSGRAAVSVGGERVTPGTGKGTFKAAQTAANEVPFPVLIVLACVAALSLAAGLAVARRRWPQTRRAALRIFRR